MNNENNILIAKKYAEALIDFGKAEKMSYVSISVDLANIQSILSKSEDLYEALTNPLISIEDKLNIIEKAFEKDVDVLIRNFLKVLTEKDRFNLIYDIIKIYNSLLDEINGIARIDVISAVELNDIEQADIQAKLAEKLKKQVVIKYKTDKSIIAGLVFKIGDDIIDMSIARKLEDYKMALTK